MFLLEKSPAYQIISARYPETIRACRLLREKIQEGSNPTKRCDRTLMIPTAQGARNVRASLYSKVQAREVVPVILSLAFLSATPVRNAANEDQLPVSAAENLSNEDAKAARTARASKILLSADS